VKPTAKFPVAIISASAAGKIQIASTDRSVESTHLNTNRIQCQQLDRQVQIITVPASTNSVESAVQSNLTVTTTRTDDNPAVVKTSETTGRVRRRRRKPRKKKQRSNRTV